MSIPLRLFTGALGLLKKSTTRELEDFYQSYYICVINSFYKNEYYSSKINNDLFTDLNQIDSKSLLSKIEIANLLVNALISNSSFINLGNLNATVFFLKQNNNYLKDISSSANYFVNKVKANEIDYFTPKIISQNNDLLSLADKVQGHINTYISSNVGIINSMAAQGLPLFNSTKYLNVMKYHKFDTNIEEAFVESFISVYMSGVAGFEAILKNEELHELLFNYVNLTQSISINFTFLFVKAEWDKLAIEAFRKNPNKIDQIESLTNSGKNIIDNFVKFDEFLTVFKGYFWLMALSQKELDFEEIDLMYEIYYQEILNKDLLYIFFCYNLIRSYPENNTSILCKRTINFAEWLYAEKPYLKPTYSKL
jgi:hypothetical protein